MLSVSAAVLAGPLAQGSQWKYQTANASGVYEFEAPSVAGPTVFAGISATEVDEDDVNAATSGSQTVKNFEEVTADGEVFYGSIVASSNGDVTTTTATPEAVLIPSVMVGGEPYSESWTSTAVVSSGPDAGSTAVTSVAYTVTLEAGAPQAVTVDAGTFSAYVIDSTEIDTPVGGGAAVTTTLKKWIDPNYGLVQETISNSSGSSTRELISYSLTTGSGGGASSGSGDSGGGTSTGSSGGSTGEGGSTGTGTTGSGSTGSGSTGSGSTGSGAGTAAQLEFVQEPTDVNAGVSISPALAVDVEDAYGNVVTDGSAVMVAIASGPTGAVLGGTVMETAVNGVATFADLTVNLPGTYTLTATDGALSPAISSSFDVAGVTTGSGTSSGGGASTGSSSGSGSGTSGGVGTGTGAPASTAANGSVVPSVVSVTLPSTFVPGDVGSVELSLSNTGTTAARGAVGVQLFLSPDGLLSDATAVSAPALKRVNVGLLAGKSAGVGARFVVPMGLAAGDYSVLAQLSSLRGFVGSSVSTTAVEADDAREAVLGFGTVGARHGVRLTESIGGNRVVFAVAGPGTGILTLDGTGGYVLGLTGTTAASRVVVSAAKGAVLDGISDGGALGELAAGKVNVDGDVSIAGGTRELVLGNVSESNISLGGTGAAVVSMGTVTDSTLSCGGELASVLVGSWSDSLVGNDVTAAGIGRLLSRGSFSASVVSAGDIGSILIGGDLSGSSILAGDVLATGTTVAAEIGVVRVGGSVTGSVIGAGFDSGDDTVGAGGRIAAVAIGGSLDSTSKVAAAELPARVRVGKAVVVTSVDGRFEI